MSYQVVRQVETTKTDDNGTRRDIVIEKEVKTDFASLSVRIIWYVVGVLLLLLTFRFLLALLGANPGNGFASFIYDTSHPLVSPFFSLFGSDIKVIDGSRFEIYTLVAMAVYTAVAFGITRLVTLGKNTD